MALNLHSVEILIFDMDDTLFDTYGQLVKPASSEACAAMIRAGLNAGLSQCLKARSDLAVSQPRKNVYAELVAHFGVNIGADAKEIARLGFDAFHDREIKETIKPFEDTHETLNILARDYPLYLVTLGTPKTQQKKVALLGFKDIFKDVFFVDVNTEKNKSAAFKKILMLNPNLPPEAFVSIGNRIDGDVKDAKELGMQAILMEHGEYLHLKPITPFEEPNQRIKKLRELTSLLKKEALQ